MSLLFDGFTGLYDSFMKLFGLDDCHVILKEIERRDCSVIHDVGGGTGTLADLLVKSGKTVYLIDPSRAMTTAAGKRNSGIHIINSGYKRKLDVPMADVVVLKDAFHHIKEQEEVLRCCFDNLCEQGRIIIQDFNPKSLSSKLLFMFERCCFERIYPMHPDKLKKLSENIGLNTEFFELNPRDYIYIGTKKHCEWHKGVS